MVLLPNPPVPTVDPHADPVELLEMRPAPAVPLPLPKCSPAPVDEDEAAAPPLKLTCFFRKLDPPGPEAEAVGLLPNNPPP